MILWLLAPGAGSQRFQQLAIAVIRGIAASLMISMVITSTVH